MCLCPFLPAWAWAGWPFTPAGRKWPALSGGKPDEGGALPGRQTGGQPDQKEQDGKKDKDDED